MLDANLMALSFIESELWAIEVYITGIGILDVFSSCDLDLDPMTFIHCATEVFQNKIPHQTICNISATSGLILNILEAA